MADIQVTIEDAQPINVSLGEAVNVYQGSGGAAVDSVNLKTGHVVLNPDDLDDTATTNKFVTAAEKTKLANLSGTNTGDQDLSGYVQTTNAPELIRDTIGSTLVAGSNVTITPDDVNDTITIAASGGGGGERLLASYTHSSNLSVQPTAVDLATGVYTAVGHGLTTGLGVSMYLNKWDIDFLPLYTPGNIIPPNNMATVTVLTPDTFTLGGYSSYAVNGTMDLTKWHFETYPASLGVQIQLPSLTQYARVEVLGRGSMRYVEQFGGNTGDTNSWVWIPGGSSDIYGSTNTIGPLYGRATVIVETDKKPTFLVRSFTASYNNTTSNTYGGMPAAIGVDRMGPENTNFDKIRLSNGRICNGTKVEVWGR